MRTATISQATGILQSIKILWNHGHRSGLVLTKMLYGTWLYNKVFHLFLVILGFELRALCLLGRWSYKLSHTPSPFLLHFSDRFSCFLLMASLNCNPPTYALGVSGFIDLSHHDRFVCWDGSSLTFCPGWPQTTVFLISTFWVAETTGKCHCAWLTDWNGVSLTFCSGWSWTVGLPSSWDYSRDPPCPVQ
jgi:hypothetical protein